MYNYFYRDKPYFATETNGDVRLYMRTDRGLVVRGKAVLMSGMYFDARDYFNRLKKPLPAQ